MLWEYIVTKTKQLETKRKKWKKWLCISFVAVQKWNKGFRKVTQALEKHAKLSNYKLLFCFEKNKSWER